LFYCQCDLSEYYFESKKKKQWGKFDCREEVPVVHHKRPTIPHLLVTAQNQQSERTNSLQFELRQFYNKNEIPKVPENNLLLHM
jgi:hypothetical protein